MTEKDCIEFYRSILKVYPTLLQLPEKDACKRLGGAYKILYDLEPTRDHIRIALAQHQGNKVKRAWDLKQRYLISAFLQNQYLSNKDAHALGRNLFDQRTRIGVVESCRQEAIEFRKNRTPAEVAEFIQSTLAAFQAKSKEPNVLTA